MVLKYTKMRKRSKNFFLKSSKSKSIGWYDSSKWSPNGRRKKGAELFLLNRRVFWGQKMVPAPFLSRGFLPHRATPTLEQLGQELDVADQVGYVSCPPLVEGRFVKLRKRLLWTFRQELPHDCFIRFHLQCVLAKL